MECPGGAAADDDGADVGCCFVLLRRAAASSGPLSDDEVRDARVLGVFASASRAAEALRRRQRADVLSRFEVARCRFEDAYFEDGAADGRGDEEERSAREQDLARWREAADEARREGVEALERAIERQAVCAAVVARAFDGVRARHRLYDLLDEAEKALSTTTSSETPLSDGRRFALERFLRAAPREVELLLEAHAYPAADVARARAVCARTDSA